MGNSRTHSAQPVLSTVAPDGSEYLLEVADDAQERSLMRLTGEGLRNWEPSPTGYVGAGIGLSGRTSQHAKIECTNNPRSGQLHAPHDELVPIRELAVSYDLHDGL